MNSRVMSLQKSWSFARISRRGMLLLITVVLFTGLSRFAAAQAINCRNSVVWETDLKITVPDLTQATENNCNTPVIFGVHRGVSTRAMDLANGQLVNPQPVYPGTSYAQGERFTNPVYLSITPSNSNLATAQEPIYPNSYVAIAAAGEHWSNGKTISMKNSTGGTDSATIQNLSFGDRTPLLIEVDARQDKTGQWYFIHGAYSRTDTDESDNDELDIPTNAPAIATSQDNLSTRHDLYRGASLREPIQFLAATHPANDLLPVGNILLQLMFDQNFNSLLQIHTRSYEDSLAFYKWLLEDFQVYARDSGANYFQLQKLYNQMFFCLDLKSMVPSGTVGSGSNLEANIYNGFSLYSDAVIAIKKDLPSYMSTHKYTAIASPQLFALMINFYDDVDMNATNDAKLEKEISDNMTVYKDGTNVNGNVVLLGFEMTDEGSSINPRMQEFAAWAEQKGFQIERSVLTPDHYTQVNGTFYNCKSFFFCKNTGLFAPQNPYSTPSYSLEPASYYVQYNLPMYKWGGVSASHPTELKSYNNTPLNKQYYVNNIAPWSDLNWSYSFQMQVKPSNVAEPPGNPSGPLTNGVRPTMILTDLPNWHGSGSNGDDSPAIPFWKVTP